MTSEEVKQKTAQTFGYSDWDSILADYKSGEINDKIFKGIIDNVANGFAMIQLLEVGTNEAKTEPQPAIRAGGFQAKLQQRMRETEEKANNSNH